MIFPNRMSLFWCVIDKWQFTIPTNIQNHLTLQSLLTKFKIYHSVVSCIGFGLTIGVTEKVANPGIPTTLFQ